MLKKFNISLLAVFISANIHAATVNIHAATANMQQSQQNIPVQAGFSDLDLKNGQWLEQMTGSPEAGTSISAVVKLIDQQNYQQAKKKLTDILSSEPKNAVAYALKGFILVKENKLAKATTALLKANELKPRSPELHAQLASVFLQQSQRLKSEQQAFIALEFDKEQPQALMVLARLHEDAGKTSKAIELLHYSIASAKKRGLNILPAVISLAQIYNRTGYYGATYQLLQPLVNATAQKKGIPPVIALLFTETSLQTTHLNDAKLGIELLSKNAKIAKSIEVQVLKARYLFASQQQEQGIALLEKLIETSQQNKSMLRYALFNLLKKTNQVDKAINVLEVAIKSEPQAEFRAVLLRDFSNYLFLENRAERVLNLTAQLTKQFPNDLQLGFLYASAQKYLDRNKPALETLDKLIKQQADFASAYSLKAEILSQLNQPSKAEYVLRKALKIEPSRIKDWISLAYLAHHTGGHKALLAVINEGLQHNPNNVELKLEIAAVHNEEGALDEANKIYQQILAKNKTNISALMHIAYNIAQQKDSKAQAMTFIQQAKQLAPDNPNVIAGYGRILYLMGENSQALDALQTALKQLPKSGQLHYWIATTLSALDNKVEAAKELNIALQLGLNTSEKKQALLLVEQLK